MAQVFWLLGFASLFRSCSAVPWMGAMQTPNGLMAIAGISPRPTQAPGLNGIPKELKRRANYQYPPPENWCGFVDGDYANPLTCASQDICYASSTVAGCCSDTAKCESIGIATSCAGFNDQCNDACMSDPLVLKCANPNLAYCGTYSFFVGTYLYNCESSNNYGLASSVEFVNDFYITAIGSSYTPPSVSAITVDSSTSTRPFFRTSSSLTPTPSPSPNVDDDHNSHLGSAIIGGIVAGAVVICALVGLLTWICIRRRKRARLAASQQLAQHGPATFNPQGGPPMQQQQQQYQPVPQQDNNTQNNSQYQPAQGYFPAPPLPGKDSGPFAHVSPVGSPAPSTVDPAARPFSLVSSHHPSEGGQTIQPPQQNLSPPVPGYAGPLAGGAGGGAAQDYYKQPPSPNIGEVDGTQGNPGVPHGAQQGANEVDGTQGNPGVPYNQQQYSGPYEMH